MSLIISAGFASGPNVDKRRFVPREAVDFILESPTFSRKDY